VIGAGIAGRSHLLDAVSSPGLDVTAVCCRRIESAASAANDFGVAHAYDDIASMLREQRPQAVVVATPPALLAQHVRMCMVAGCDVLAEKPLGTRSLHASHLRQLEAETGAQLRIAYPRRYRAAWRRAAAWIRAGRIGRLKRVECRWSGPYRSRHSPDAPTYRADPAQRVAGAVLDSGSHALDAILHLTGEVGEVEEAQIVVDDRCRTDVGCRVRLRQRRDMQAVLILQDDRRDEERRVAVITGTAGTIVIDDREARLRCRDGDDCCRDRDVRRPVDDLLAFSQGGVALGCTPDEAGAVLAAIGSIYRRAGTPLPSPWRRPRAKAWARPSGAC